MSAHSPVAAWRRLPLIRSVLGFIWADPFAWAVLDGDVEAASRALKKGARVDDHVCAVESSDEKGVPSTFSRYFWIRYGKTSLRRVPALVYAASQDDAEMVGLLIAHGANLAARGKDDYDHDALGVAVLARHWSCAEKLVDAGARWDTPVWIIDAHSMVSAMVAGGLDLGRLQSIQTTLEELVLGHSHSLRDTLNSVRLCEDPKAKELWHRHQARCQKVSLEQSLPCASAVRERSRF